MAADLFGGWSPLPRTSIGPYRTTPVGYHIGWPEEYASPATKKSIEFIRHQCNVPFIPHNMQLAAKTG